MDNEARENSFDFRDTAPSSLYMEGQEPLLTYDARPTHVEHDLALGGRTTLGIGIFESWRLREVRGKDSRFFPGDESGGVGKIEREYTRNECK